MSYHSKVVIVTGAGKGIGYAMANMYAKKGAIVIIAEKDQVSGQACADIICRNGGEAFFKQTDVADPKQIVDLIKLVEQKYHRIDILINNAGISRWVDPCELAVEEWDQIININLRGTFVCSREAAKIMRQHGGGAIVNISSTRALMSEANSEAYAASKGGIVSLTHAMALSFGKDKIRVNAISPGWIETGDYEALKNSDHLQHPVGRVGKPQDVANACLFLTDESNSFITGINLVLDGGMTKKMIYEE